MLQNILHNHDENGAGHDVITAAWDCMVDMAKLINELKRMHDGRDRVDALTRSLDSGSDIVGFGELILEVATSFSLIVIIHIIAQVL